MAKTAAKQPIGQPEPDAHISMYEQAKWPLTKRDQTYLSQANKFWTFINTDTYLVGFAPVSGSDIFALYSCSDICALSCEPDPAFAFLFGECLCSAPPIVCYPHVITGEHSVPLCHTVLLLCFLLSPQHNIASP